MHGVRRQRGAGARGGCLYDGDAAPARVAVGAGRGGWGVGRRGGKRWSVGRRRRVTVSFNRRSARRRPPPQRRPVACAVGRSSVARPSSYVTRHITTSMCNAHSLDLTNNAVGRSSLAPSIARDARRTACITRRRFIGEPEVVVASIPCHPMSSHVIACHSRGVGRSRGARLPALGVALALVGDVGRGVAVP